MFSFFKGKHIIEAGKLKDLHDFIGDISQDHLTLDVVHLLLGLQKHPKACTGEIQYRTYLKTVALAFISPDTTLL